MLEHMLAVFQIVYIPSLKSVINIKSLYSNDIATFNITILPFVWSCLLTFMRHCVLCHAVFGSVTLRNRSVKLNHLSDRRPISFGWKSLSNAVHLSCMIQSCYFWFHLFNYNRLLSVKSTFLLFQLLEWQAVHAVFIPDPC